MRNCVILTFAWATVGCSSTPVEVDSAVREYISRRMSEGGQDLTKYKIADIHRGMSSNQVESGLEANGYKLVSSTESVSYEELVKQKQELVAGRYADFGSGRVAISQTFRKNRETIWVGYIQAPDGNAARHIRYSMPEDLFNRAAVASTLEQRYGPPTHSSRNESEWCENSSQICISQNHVTLDLRGLTLFGDAPDTDDIQRVIEKTLRRAVKPQQSTI